MLAVRWGISWSRKYRMPFNPEPISNGIKVQMQQRTCKGRRVQGKKSIDTDQSWQPLETARPSSLMAWAGGFIIDLRKAEIEVCVTDQADLKRALELYLSGELVDRPELGCDHKHE